jgi:hypothetical protein
MRGLCPAAVVSKFAAVDSHFLAALEAYDDDAAEICDGLQLLQLHLLVTPTVLQEIADTERNSTDPDARVAAAAILKDYRGWLILDPPLTPVQNGVAEIMAKKLIEEEVIPDTELNAGLIVAEAALHECQILITHRQSLINSDLTELGLVWLGAATPPLIVDADSVLKALRDHFETKGR